MKNSENVVEILYFTENLEVKTLLQNSTLRGSGLLNATTMHHALERLLNNIHWPPRNHRQDFWLDLHKAGVREENNLIENESVELLRSLRRCQKVALLLPEYLCRNSSRMLKKVGHQSNVFVGKEVISDVEWLFSLRGSVPPHIPLRIKATYESGIWRRWENLAKRVEADTGNTDVLAASMDGNIIVIFCVWFCGLAGSLLWLFAETWYCDKIFKGC